MSIRFQHYVPQVYLRAWESKVVSIKEPKKEFMGVYYFEKDKLEIGDYKVHLIYQQKDFCSYLIRFHRDNFEIHLLDLQDS